MLDRDAIVICDGGDFASYAGRAIESYEPGCWLDPARSAASAAGPGYALAAKLARPDRQVVLLLGDGAFGFCGMEWDTLARHGVGVVGVMGNNGIWGLEKHPMEFLYGYSVVADLRPGDALRQRRRGARRPRRARARAGRAEAGAGARARRRRAGARERADGSRRSPTRARPTSPRRREAASRRGEAASSWPRQDGQGYVPWGPLCDPGGGRRRLMRQSPGSMRRGTTAGGTTALTDDPSIPPVSRRRHRTNVQNPLERGGPAQAGSRELQRDAPEDVAVGDLDRGRARTRRARG